MKRDDILPKGGYSALPKATLREAILKPAAKLVLMSLIDRLGENEVAWPSTATIAEDTGLSERGVEKCLERLTELGFISPAGKYYRHTKWEVISTQSTESKAHTVRLQSAQSAPSSIDTENSKAHTVRPQSAQSAPSERTEFGFKRTECGAIERPKELPQGTTEGTTEARAALRGSGNPSPSFGASLVTSDAGGIPTAANPKALDPQKTSDREPTQTANPKALDAQKTSEAQKTFDTQSATEQKPTSTPAAPTDYGRDDAWQEIEVSFINAEFEDDDFGEFDDAPVFIYAPSDQPAADRPETPAPPDVEPASQPATVVAPVAVADAAKQPATAGRAKSARQKPKPSKASDKLDDAERKKICESFESIEQYLLFGKTAVLTPDADQTPTQFNWRVNTVTPGEFTEAATNASAWTIPQLAGFFWFRVSICRKERGLEHSLPNWGRLLGEIRNLQQRIGGNWRAMKYISCLTHLFDLHCVMSGSIGEHFALNETMINNSIIRNRVEFYLQQSKDQQQAHFDQYAEKMIERKRRYPGRKKIEADE
jgi:hypothetical protein